MNDRLIQTQRLYQIIDLETFILLSMLGIVAFLFYRFFLKKVSEERHNNLKNHFKVLLKYFITMSVLYGIFFLGSQSLDDSENVRHILPYVGLITFISGAFFFVKTSRLIVLQYLFLGSMRAGVPSLLVNIFSLVLSILILFWTVSVIFGVQLTPLLATSAAFSIILGLALQDTLGNLFAGISLQIDKTFEIGDWLEIMNGTVKIVGQVKELSWRSTVLVGFTDESIVLPNKLVAQSQVSNFSPEGQPIVRSQSFKIAFGADLAKTIELLEQSASQISDIRGIPAPFAYVTETTDHGITIKLVYFIENYGRQFVIADKVFKIAFDFLAKNGIQIARPSLQIRQGD
ncbi:MAG: mechanosensitive ion channel family protein [Bdellovibrionaceae bacterium]|nr:mechanosensitive ion channel family protein [Bdellovibrio sp.]